MDVVCVFCKLPDIRCVKAQIGRKEVAERLNIFCVVLETYEV